MPSVSFYTFAFMSSLSFTRLRREGVLRVGID